MCFIGTRSLSMRSCALFLGILLTNQAEGEFVGFTTVAEDEGLTRYGCVPGFFSADTSGLPELLPLTTPSPSDGCSPLYKDGKETIRGSVVLIDRSPKHTATSITCSFDEKVKHALDAGAVAVVIANSFGNHQLPPRMAPAYTPGTAIYTQTYKKIPVCMVTQTHGMQLRRWAQSQAETSKPVSKGSISLHNLPLCWLFTPPPIFLFCSALLLVLF